MTFEVEETGALNNRDRFVNFVFQREKKSNYRNLHHQQHSIQKAIHSARPHHRHAYIALAIAYTHTTYISNRGEIKVKREKNYITASQPRSCAFNKSIGIY
jgi:hypothetical protein